MFNVIIDNKIDDNNIVLYTSDIKINIGKCQPIIFIIYIHLYVLIILISSVRKKKKGLDNKKY